MTQAILDLWQKKWNNDQSNANNDEGKEIIYNTEALKSNLFYYKESYIIQRGDNITRAHNNPSPVALLNCATFINRLTRIDGKQ